MKILHTADWHLGQRLKNFIRDDEHHLALEWLHQTIVSEGVNLLIVAGDIFDIMNPPNSSRRLYYKFLAKLSKTHCDYIIIIGGNHDSPNMLNAPSELLESLNIHVIGCATEDISNEIIELKKGDKIEAVVAAVPFLRDQDLRKSTMGEGEMDRYEKVQKGIINHYQEVANKVEKYKELNIPIITTGHLYASGAFTNSENQDNIYMGSVENIGADDFPMVFDYVALGHIHSAQPIGDLYHVRYSGSLIPLTFKEGQEDKSVTLIEFEGRQMIAGVKEIPVPCFRKLISIQGNYEEVLNKLQTIEIGEEQFKSWLKIEVEVEKYEYAIEETIRQLCKSKGLILLMLKIIAPFSEEATFDYHINLDELQPVDIFKQKCESIQLSDQENTLMMETFDELMVWELERSDVREGD